MEEVKIKTRGTTVWLFHGRKPCEGIVNEVFTKLNNNNSIDISYDITIQGKSVSHRYDANQLFDSKEELKVDIVSLFDE